MSGVTFHCELDTWGWGGVNVHIGLAPDPKVKRGLKEINEIMCLSVQQLCFSFLTSKVQQHALSLEINIKSGIHLSSSTAKINSII